MFEPVLLRHMIAWENTVAKTSRGRCIHRCSMLHPVLFIRHCAGYKQLYIRQKSLPSFLSPSDLLSSPFCSLLFEQSEFLTATSQKKNLCVCSTNLGFSVGYVLCTRYVCTTLYDTRYVWCTRFVWYQVRIMYQIRVYFEVPHLPLYYW